jgi:hypothetical protein
MPRECHFRMGRGRVRERRLALSWEGYAHAMAWLYGWDTSFYRHCRAMGARTL